VAGLTNAGTGAMLLGFANSATFLSLHSADPATNGSSEISGGSYARQSISWSSPTSGSTYNSSLIVFSLPAGASVSYVGYWSALNGGTFYGSRALDATNAFPSAGSMTIAIGDLSEEVA